MAKVDPVQLEKFLQGVHYPAGRQALIDQAQKNGADQNVLSTLKAIPAKQYDSPVDVSEAVGTVK